MRPRPGPAMRFADPARSAGEPARQSASRPSSSSFFPARLEHQALDAVGAKARSIGAMTAFSISPALVFGDRQGGAARRLQGALRNPDLAVPRRGWTSAGRCSTRSTARRCRCRSCIEAAHRRSSGEGVRSGGYYRVASRIVGNGRHGTRHAPYLGSVAGGARSGRRQSRRATALVSLAVFLAGWPLVVLGLGALAARPLTTHRPDRRAHRRRRSHPARRRSRAPSRSASSPAPSTRWWTTSRPPSTSWPG